MKKDELSNMTIDQLKTCYKKALTDAGATKNMVSTATSQAFYIYRHFPNINFKELLFDDCFEEKARGLLDGLKYKSQLLSDVKKLQNYVVNDDLTIKHISVTPKTNIVLTPENKIIKKQFNLNIEEIVQAIENYHASMNENYTRYKSWTNCYFVFKGNRKPVLDEKELEYLCLHLSAYLASWGMLRNSKLIDFDFWVHKDFIIEIMNEKYDCFYNDDFFNIDLIFEVVDLIKKSYPDAISKTDTLITKILLGIFGCVPAYDRYFKNGISKYKIAGQNFNYKSLTNINEFYSLYANKFETLRCKYIEEGHYYTKMKLIDMAFWQLGQDK